MARKSVTHYRIGRNYVTCGADRQRSNWGVVRDVVSVASLEAWDATSAATRCTRCAVKVEKMRAAKAKNDARAQPKPPAPAKPLPAALQRLRDRHDALHANDGASMGLLS